MMRPAAVVAATLAGLSVVGRVSAGSDPQAYRRFEVLTEEEARLPEKAAAPHP